MCHSRFRAVSNLLSASASTSARSIAVWVASMSAVLLQRVADPSTCVCSAVVCFHRGVNTEFVSVLGVVRRFGLIRKVPASCRHVRALVAPTRWGRVVPWALRGLPEPMTASCSAMNHLPLKVLDSVPVALLAQPVCARPPCEGIGMTFTAVPNHASTSSWKKGRNSEPKNAFLNFDRLNRPNPSR